MRRTRVIWKKPWGLVSLFFGLTLIQFVVLFGIDQFLRSPSLSAVAAVSSGKEPAENKPEVPADAIRYEYSPDNQYAAYTTSDDELVIVNGPGECFHEQVGKVTYLHWLGQSNALVYFVGGSHVTGYLLHVDGSKPTKIYSWYGSKREVVNTYFSPYLEFLYIEMRNGERSEVYKFDAVDGISQLPLGDIRIEHIDYDDKSDIMRLTTSNGDVWRYEEDRLYRPDGTEVRQSQPVRHHRTEQREYSNKK